ncbi:MAG: TadE/TadG family type IV pilus assembly protein [Alphaproteobacteria bacterium]
MGYYMNIARLWRRWLVNNSGVSSVEAALIFPVMLLIMVGVYDLGNALLANQKAIRASQIVADLTTRENIVTDSDISEIIQAGRLAFEPLSSESYGVDIVSIRFDEDANSEIVWRETHNMTAIADPIGRVSALATPDEGVVMVAVVYDYNPLITDFVIGAIQMQEVAFSRGRNSSVITRQ